MGNGTIEKRYFGILMVMIRVNNGKVMIGRQSGGTRLKTLGLLYLL